MDPRYQELYDIIDDYNEISKNEKYNCFATWAMIHFSDVCTRGDVYIQQTLKEVRELKLGNITMDEIVCNDEDHCVYIKHIMDVYELFLDGKFPDPFWADHISFSP